MKHKLPIISLVLAAAATVWMAADVKHRGTDRAARAAGKDSLSSPASLRSTQELDGNRLLAQAAEAVARFPNLSGKVRQRSQLLGRRIAGTGQYRQWFDGELLRYRFDLRMPLGKEPAHFMQLGDGRFVWTRRDLPSQRQLQRVDERLVESALLEAEKAGRAPRVSLQGMTLAGGLGGILRRLERQFQFEPAQPGTLGREQLPVLTIRGGWKPDVLRQAYPNVADDVLAGKTKHLPPTVPTHAEIVLGREKPLAYFPYRISLLRQDASGTIRMMDLEFFSLAQNTPIDPADFRYDPGGQHVEDATERVLNQLRSRLGPAGR